MRSLWMSILLTASSALGQESPLWVGLEKTAELLQVDPEGVGTKRIPLPAASARCAVGGRGQVWALDEANERLLLTDPAGELLGIHATPRQPCALSIDGRDRVWVLSNRDRLLAAYTSLGTLERSVSLPSGCTDFTIDAFSRLHVANPSRGSVYTYSEDGTLLRTVSGMPGATHVTASHLGDLFATNSRRGSIHRIPLGGAESELLLDVPGRITKPLVDGNGRLWFASVRHDRLARLDPTGRALSWFPTAGHPTTLALGLDGDIWVGCAREACLQRFTNSGKLRGSLTLEAAPNLEGDPAGTHFLTLLRPLDDLDGDGYGNRAEWVAATNPASARSVPAHVEARGGNGTWQVDFRIAHPAPAHYLAYLTVSARPGTLLANFDGADLRVVPTTVVDPVFLWSGQDPRAIDRPRGRLDAFGRGRVQVSLPPELHGMGVAFAFVTLDRASGTSPSGLRVISKALPLPD